MKPLIIFDLDGTLYVFDNSNSVNFASSKFYKTIKSNAYRFLQKRLNMGPEEAKETYEDIKRNFDGELSLGLEAKFGVDRYEWFEAVWDLNPRDFIKQKSRKELVDSLNAEVSILTAAPRVWASKALDYLGLPEYKRMLFTGESNLRKPNPVAFKQICDKAGIPPEKTVSIGDQVASDILPAKSLGMRTILVRTQSNEADYCINSLDELPEVYKNLSI